MNVSNSAVINSVELMRKLGITFAFIDEDSTFHSLEAQTPSEATVEVREKLKDSEFFTAYLFSAEEPERILEFQKFLLDDEMYIVSVEQELLVA